jgi:hypothetical protein
MDNSSARYRFIAPVKRGMKYIPAAALVFVLALAYTLIVYRGTLSDVPRSDSVIIHTILNRLSFPGDISRIAFMELLGQSRFQPLAWLLEFFQVKVFGTHFQYYHLIVVLLHALNTALVFQLVRSLTRKTVPALLAAAVFVTLYTNLPSIAWPISFYSLLSVSLSLLAVLIIRRFVRLRRRLFLYLAYGLAFFTLFLYEPNIFLPGVLLLLALLPGWNEGNRRSLFLGNALPATVVYIVYGVLYFSLMPRFAGTPGSIVTGANVLYSLSGVPVEFFNTVFLHNTFATSRVIFDELLFYVPFTAQSFTWWGGLSRYNILSYLVLFGLVITTRRPARGHLPLAGLLFLWAVGYTAVILLGRDIAYTISQPRHAYFPALLLIVTAALFYESCFDDGNGTPAGFLSARTRSATLILVAAVVVLFNLNTAKTVGTLQEYEGYRSYTNNVYYTAARWLSDINNRENTLFLAVSAYPSHEKLAWGDDIVPYVFLDDPRLTLNLDRATHVLVWPDGEAAPRVVAREASGMVPEPDDFSLTFGIMPHPRITERYVEILSPADTSAGRRWWLRLYSDDTAPPEADRSGGYRLELGYTWYQDGNEVESLVFRSRPVNVPQVTMTHFVLVKYGGEYGLILDGRLLEKAPDETGEELNGDELALGPLYRMEYRKPYYFAHTYLEFGHSRYDLQDAQPGDKYAEIQFQPQGFQPYHLSLNY